MSNSVKLALYVVLVTLACVSGSFALRAFGKLMDKSRVESELEKIERDTPVHQSSDASPATNNADPATVLTNSPSTTNLAAGSSASTNTPPGATNTTVTPAQPDNPAVATALGGRSGEATQNQPRGSTRIGLWMGLFVISLVGLGLLIARDVSHYMGNRALKVLYNDDGDGVKNPEYEAAEQMWANGDHLEAIRMMREYLNKNPREQYVALRIAEIYEKDLQNHLAAALEYEEVLKHKLAPDRWGWAAIHLCNLYFKLNQEQKAYDLLRRIVADYGHTPAAEKARKRLEQVGEPAELQTETQVRTSPAVRVSAAQPDQPASNLPPGFKPKK